MLRLRSTLVALIAALLLPAPGAGQPVSFAEGVGVYDDVVWFRDVGGSAFHRWSIAEGGWLPR